MKRSYLYIFTYAVLFFVFFHQESFGLNTLLLTILTTAILVVQSLSVGRLLKSWTQLQWGFLGVFWMSAAAVILSNGNFATWIFALSFLSTVGLFHSQSTQSFPVALILGVESFLVTLGRLPKLASESTSSRTQYYFKIVALPILGLALFLALFGIGNSDFADFLNSFFGKFFERIADWFNGFKNTTLGLMVLSFLLAVFVTVLPAKLFLDKKENNNIEFLKRQKSIKKLHPRLFFGLKKEWLAGVFFLTAINILLLVVNAVDFRKVWVAPELNDAVALSKFVHVGTYILISIILLSMSIVLYLFRGNLNFYIKSRILKILAIIWMLQNCFLLASVAMRNLHYINFTHALTFKRIGLMVFLFFVLVGLILLVGKVWLKWSGYRVYRIQSLAIGGTLVALAFVNWSDVIVKYNLSNPVVNNIEFEYLIEHCNAHAIDDLYRFIDTQKGKYFHLNHPHFSGRTALKKAVDIKAENYLSYTQEHTWFSYTISGAHLKNKLKRRTNDYKTKK